MEVKPSLEEQMRRAAVERMILNHFNDTLLNLGIITTQEHEKMRVQIVTRKSGRKAAR